MTLFIGLPSSCFRTSYARVFNKMELHASIILVGFGMFNVGFAVLQPHESELISKDKKSMDWGCKNLKTKRSIKKKYRTNYFKRLIRVKRALNLVNFAKKHASQNRNFRFENGELVTVSLCSSTVGTLADDGNDSVATTLQNLPPSSFFTTATPAPAIVCSNNAILKAGERQSIVREHNEMRRKVAPPATNMRLLTWDNELAWIAEQHTRECTYQEHSAFAESMERRDIKRHSYLNAEVGFNWYAWENTADLPRDFIFDVMRGWMEEKRFYNHEQKTCSAVCRHYLQVSGS